MANESKCQFTGGTRAHTNRQMIRQKLPVIIFLTNNKGYTIGVEIHDGPYNNVKNWDYAGLISAFNAEDGRGRGAHLPTMASMIAEAASRTFNPKSRSSPRSAS